MTVSVAIAGAGKGSTPFSANLGSRIAKALLARGADVKILLRATSTKPDDLDGAQLVTIDYAEPETLAEALRGVDVVVSALAGEGLASQLPLARAAKSAGVQLFMPSEFGNRTPEAPPPGPLAGKANFQKELRNLGLPYALIWCGPFADFNPFFLTPKGGKIRLVGDGETLVSFTALESVANFVGHLLTTYPTSELANKAFPNEDARTSFKVLAEHVVAKAPAGTVEIVYEPIAAARKRWDEQHDIVAFLVAEWAEGGGLVGPVDELKNGLYPGWKKIPVESFL